MVWFPGKPRDPMHGVCYFGGGSKGSTQTQTIQKADPWGPQQPYLKDIFSQAKGLYNSWNPSYFPGDTVADMTPWQMGGLNAMAAMGQPSAYQTAGENEVTKTLGGDYLSAGNPYFQGMADRVMETVVPQVSARFTAGNSGNSSLAARAVGQAASDAVGNLAYQNYADERTNQQRALALAPTLQQMGLTNAQSLLQAGGALQGQNQAEIDQAVNRFNFNQNIPVEKLQLYRALIDGSFGGSTSGTSTQTGGGSSGLASGLSGALAGGLGAAGLASAFPATLGFLGGPIGLGAGALVGLLGGLFG